MQAFVASEDLLTTYQPTNKYISTGEPKWERSIAYETAFITWHARFYVTDSHPWKISEQFDVC